MSVVEFILTVMAATGLARATSSLLTDVMSLATGYEVQLHSNVTAYDICMYLATGYQYNLMGINTNITTEAYDDHDRGVAKILTRHVNNEYDDTTEALDSYNKTQRVVNFDVADCKNITDDEVISWYFSKSAEGTYHDRELELTRRASAKKNRCWSPGQDCKPKGKLDVGLCLVANADPGTSCGCAEYGSSAAACQTSHLYGTVWYTDHHRNWGAVTALQISFRGVSTYNKRLVGFIGTDQDY